MVSRVLLALSLALTAGCGGGSSSPGSSASGPFAPRCGNGILEADEACDAGGENSDVLPDACRTTCVKASCGDGVVDAGEACDAGAANDDLAPGACRTSCVAAGCGDGVLDAGEDCDQGAGNSDRLPDACRTTCVPPRCGDGVRDLGEGCDNGAENSDRPGACRTDCRVPRCGDGVVDPGEACDDGEANGDGPDACRAVCEPARCGDGVVDSGEGCDDGNGVDGDGCESCAVVVPSCGDHVVVDLTSGTPWTGDELTYVGTFPDQDLGWRTCNPYVPGEHRPDAILALPIPRDGDLIVEVRSTTGSFRPVVELRGDCTGQPVLACETAPTANEAAIAVVPVRRVEGLRWILVESGNGPAGEYRLTARIMAPLPDGAPCATDSTAGVCAPGLGCADPDGDGTGDCRPLVAAGGACDPAGHANLCVETVCIGGTCSPSCGDGTAQPWEECDDGDLAAEDNCTAECRVAGRDCNAPYRLGLAPASGGFEWKGATTIGSQGFTASCGWTGDQLDVVGSFSAPEAGTWGFRLIPEGAWNAALSLVTGACGSGIELACAAAANSGDTPTVIVDLAAGETVWPVVDGNGRAPNVRQGPFTLRVERVVCGDGILAIGEECDDGNTSDGDNCSSACVVAGRNCSDPWMLGWDAAAREAGWDGELALSGPNFTNACSSSTTAQDMVALFVAPEAGDYSFELSGEDFPAILSLRQGPCETSTELACSYLSQTQNRRNVVRHLEAGEQAWAVVDAYSALSGGRQGRFTLEVKPLACGDGIRALPEECDDGNAASGDGCSDTCTLEATEAEPNDGRETASQAPVGGLVAAALDPGVEEDWFSFPALAGETYRLRVYAGQVGNCTLPTGTQSPDPKLELFDGAGALLAANDDAGWYCPALSWTAPASGTTFARVRYATSAAKVIPRYFLEVASAAP
jgi:cysteine-rich repeat protein